MESWNIIYKVKGSLCRDFVGQITYTVSLPEVYNELEIDLHFSKEHFQPGDLTKEQELILKDYCREQYHLEPDDNEWEELLYHVMKTELHLMATLNDAFIGCIHRQRTDRTMHIDAAHATEGCFPTAPIEGVLRVTVEAFSVLMDDTEYELEVRVR